MEFKRHFLFLSLSLPLCMSVRLLQDLFFSGNAAASHRFDMEIKEHTKGRTGKEKNARLHVKVPHMYRTTDVYESKI